MTSSGRRTAPHTKTTFPSGTARTAPRRHLVPRLPSAPLNSPTTLRLAARSPNLSAHPVPTPHPTPRPSGPFHRPSPLVDRPCPLTRSQSLPYRLAFSVLRRPRPPDFAVPSKTHHATTTTRARPTRCDPSRADWPTPPAASHATTPRCPRPSTPSRADCPGPLAASHPPPTGPFCTPRLGPPLTD